MNEYTVKLTGYPEMRIKADGFNGCASGEYVFYVGNPKTSNKYEADQVAVFPGRLVDYILLGIVERD